ncbi:MULTISPECIES: mechanosensitive ion channel domain-containing protein [unclassified Lentimonas]|uniref:mechanosensitive ion channel domain-containing protein n=1 Tax=unclassified Lentimonas TaxID=2630993 RepID=UPI0013246C21|nr:MULTISPECIES: mechanosensitive ion channel domain-containing protein [unclassified Lentimonas]CAA6679551.1 Unannotated [Lentimonas sp. CC4]CAA6684787.1 Unannotated [Lentimonas sp. CC6]CAA7075423.1 Unannotated [Lentimonas sp. CC4]CAA7168914.1 Unannotated [Lentimonas sp. CC21]CAA7182167.1 Unannotated [Lentimonas sp. CC8]
MPELPQLGPVLNQLIASCLLFAGLVLFQFACNTWIKNRQFHSATYRRKWSLSLRNLRLLILVIGLILIWATELRTAAISAVAILAAIVIGTKELLMCILGSVVKTGSNAFRLGDRILVANVEGDVVDQSLLATQLQEVINGQYSGRMVSIPNSLFLNQAIFNSTLAGGKATYGLFTVKIDRKLDWAVHESALLKAAATHCQLSKEKITAIVDNLEKQGMSLPSTEPRTLVRVEDKDTLSITLRYPANVEDKLRIEQDILRDYLSQTQTVAEATSSE